ncbi:hypothetical protein NHP21005_02880 [Helicobacter sp. NHP21005]|nr:hypothetical protein NHP21005_02880 [Helicobacter sp. NHP21005]
MLERLYGGVSSFYKKCCRLYDFVVNNQDEMRLIFILHRVVHGMVHERSQDQLPDNLVISTIFLDSFINFLKNKGFSFVNIDEICDFYIK